MHGRFSMLLFLASLSVSRQLESLTEKYKTRLTENTSIANEELVILESLADLGRQVDKSVTADEVESEISSKIAEILDQVNRADALFRQDFADVRVELQTTREAVPELISFAKSQILEDIRQIQIRLNGTLEGLVKSATTAHDDWFDLSVQDLYELREFFGSWSLIQSFVFFVLVQIVIAHGMLHFRQLHCYFQQLAGQPRLQTSVEVTSV
jgi:hypothetical protein